MCGICGILSITGNADASTLHSMANLLRHRGPDDEGYIAVSTRDGSSSRVLKVSGSTNHWWASACSP